MTESTNAAQRVAGQDQSSGELVKQLSEQVSRLIRDELHLAQLEMTSKGKRAGAGIGMLGGGGVVALYGIGCLLAAAIIAIAGVISAWLAALIVGVVLLIVSGIAALAGKSQLQKSTPPVPAQTIGSVKTDVEEIKKKVQR